jgi:hypothetical protein
LNLWEEEVLVMKKCKSVRGRFLSLRAVPAVAPLSVLLAVALAGGLSGCVSNVTSSASSVGNSNHYFGTASLVGSGFNFVGGVWSITFDSATSYFDYDDVNNEYGTAAGGDPFNGSFTTSNDIVDLTLSTGSIKQAKADGGTGVGGYAVTLPGEGLLVRTGSNSTDVLGQSPSALIAAVSSAACPSFTSAETFNFVAQGTTNQGDKIAHVAYGSVQITPNGSDSCSFSNFSMVELSGTSLSPTPIQDATCSSTSEGYVLVSPITQVTQGTNYYYPLQTTTGVSPSGLLVIDPGDDLSSSTLTYFDQTATGPVGLMGVIQPSAALNVSDLVGKTYAGFESDPLSEMGTIAVVFSTNAGTGTAIKGGGFPGDDITQTARTDTTLDLGTQSTQTPGLFTSVTLTQPDFYSLCKGTSSGGTDSNGNATCIFYGAAVAGQVGGKYVIFTNINDPTATNSNGATPLAAINLALYQQ